MNVFRVGDKVRFLNEVGGGVVTEVINNEMVKVRNEDDWEMPVMISELIPDVRASYSREDMENRRAFSQSGPGNEDIRNSTEEEEEIDEEEEEQHVFIEPEIKEQKELSKDISFALVPENASEISSSHLNAFLINESGYSIFYHYLIKFKGRWIGRETGILDPGTKMFLETYKREDLNEFNAVQLQIIYYSSESYYPIDPVNRQIRLNMTRFFKETSFIKNKYFDDPAIIYLVHQREEIEKPDISAMKLSEAFKNKPESKQTPNPKSQVKVEQIEVDLHINELVETVEGLSNSQILKIQMDQFHASMEEAIRHRMKKVVFIHGVGNGILKDEIRKEVEKKYRFDQQDASFKEYGYGATLVYIRQNYRPQRNFRHKGPNRR